MRYAQTPRAYCVEARLHGSAFMTGEILPIGAQFVTALIAWSDNGAKNCANAASRSYFFLHGVITGKSSVAVR